MFNCPKKPMFKAPTGSSGPVKDTSSSLLAFSSASLEESNKEDREPGWMVRKMVNEEQKLSQSQGSNSSQEAPSSSQEVLSTMQQIPSSQESQQLPGETKTGAGWMIRLTEETFRKETGDGCEVPPAEDLNTKRSKSFVYGQLSPEVGACPLKTEENSAVQLTPSDLTYSLHSLLSVETEETGQIPPAAPFKAPSKAKTAKTGVKEVAAGKFKAPKTKGSKKKKEKDPNAPKRSKSSYLYFCEEVRAGLRQENPGLSLTELSRELWRRWGEVSDRSKYEAMAREDRARYAGEKEEYESSSPQQPKGAKSSFIFFCQELRPVVSQENPGMSVTDIGKELGRRWNDTDEAGRLKYQAMAAADRKRFKQEKESFEKSAPSPAVKGKTGVKVTKKTVSKPQKKVRESPKKSKAEKAGKLSNDEKVEENGGNDSSVLVEDLLDQVLSNMPEQSVKPPAVKKKAAFPLPAKKVVKRKVPEKVVRENPGPVTTAKKRKVAKRAKVPTEEEEVDSPMMVRKTSKKKANLETRAALLRLQKLRVSPTWALCSLPSCGKWRLLASVLDPSEVPEMFTCSDCPDQSQASCEAAQLTWDPSLDQHFVENSFTVGSLVWARLDGFPAWPAMVDDDPDSGSFFRTEGRDQGRPSAYHVVFLEAEKVKVSRSWLAVSRLTKFDSTKPSSATAGSRLLGAFQRAVQAGGESLKVRREKYCFARLYQGVWGPVWPGQGQERRDLQLLEDREISHNLLGLGELGDQDMSFTDKSFTCDVLASLPPAKTPTKPVLAKKSKPAPAQTEKQPQPPSVGLGNLYSDKAVFTQELSQLEVSFTQDEELSDSLAKEVNQAVENTNLFTPIKKLGLALEPARSPAPQTSYQTSTPVRPVKINQELQEEEVEEAPADTSAPFDDNFLQ